MSKGPGRIQQAVVAAFTGSPSATFSTDELAHLAYPGIDQVEKKHRVAVLRAADAVAKKLGWTGVLAERPGHTVIFYNRTNLRSYATSRLRSDFIWGGRPASEQERQLNDPSPQGRWRWVQPGGAWWRHVEINKARAAGDEALAQKMIAELNRLSDAKLLHR